MVPQLFTWLNPLITNPPSIKWYLILKSSRSDGNERRRKEMISYNKGNQSLDFKKREKFVPRLPINYWPIVRDFQLCWNILEKWLSIVLKYSGKKSMHQTSNSGRLSLVVTEFHSWYINSWHIESINHDKLAFELKKKYV